MAGTQDLVSAFEALNEAREKYARACSFFDGDLDEVFASERVQQLLSRAGIDDLDNINYAHIPVTTVSNRLHVTAITAVPADDTEQPEEQTDGQEDTLVDQANQALRKLAKYNQLEAELPGLFRDTCKLGDGYLFVWPVTEHEAPEGASEGDDALDTQDAGTGEQALAIEGQTVDVDIVVNCADTVYIVYDDDNPLRKAYAIKSWTYHTDDDGKKLCYHRANLYYPDRIERWITDPDKDGTRAEHWQPFEGDSRPAELPNPTGRVPFFHFRTERPYGVPLHINAYGPQQMINKLVRGDAATIDYQTFPQRYALIDPQQDQVLSNFVDPNNPEDMDDDPEGTGNTSQLSADPSAIWRLRGVSSVGQFAPADAAQFLARFDRYVQAMAEVTETPLYRFGSKFAQTPSGEALRVVDAPTVNRVKTLNRSFGGELTDAHEFALSLLGIEGVRVNAQWQPAQQVTDSEGWQTVGLKLANGVPARQALVETGYTADQVDEWLPDDAQQDLLRQVALLGQIGAAVQSLGAGVGLGVISQAEANAVVMRVLGLSLREGGVPVEDIPEWDPEGEGKKELLAPQPAGGQPGQAPSAGGEQNVDTAATAAIQ